MRTENKTMQSYDIPKHVESDPSENITDLLLHRVHESPELGLFSIDQGDGTWEEVKAREFHEQVVKLAKGFIAAGIQPVEESPASTGQGGG